MIKGPVKIGTNALLDTLLKGLGLNGEYSKYTLGKLSTVSKSFSQRISQSFIQEQLLSHEEEPHLGLSASEMTDINKFIDYIGCEMPNAQPRDSQEWDIYLSVPKSIKQSIIALYPTVGPQLLTYAIRLCKPNSDELNGLCAWVNALEKLYASAKEEPDLFHGLFLNNHNFAKRAFVLAHNTTVYFSANVLAVCSECRFSSLTMNSIKLNEVFDELANYYEERNRKERRYSNSFGWVNPQISASDIKQFIKEKFYAKTLLWRSITASTTTSAMPSQEGSQNLKPAEDKSPSPTF